MPFEPKLRIATLVDYAAAIERAKVNFGPKTPTPAIPQVLQSCLNCLNFDHANEMCKRFQQRPPAKVIAFSCPSYEDENDIPF